MGTFVFSEVSGIIYYQNTINKMTAIRDCGQYLCLNERMDFKSGIIVGSKIRYQAFTDEDIVIRPDPNEPDSLCV